TSHSVERFGDTKSETEFHFGKKGYKRVLLKANIRQKKKTQENTRTKQYDVPLLPNVVWILSSGFLSTANGITLLRSLSICNVVSASNPGGFTIEGSQRNRACKVLKGQGSLPCNDTLLWFTTVVVSAGSKSHPPMLNKENYVPGSSRLLRYAKNRPNGKLIHNSIISGPYIRRMIPEPEADDQAIQTILLGLPEDIYAAVDSCKTAQEIWLRVQQMMKGSDIGIQEKKVKLFNEWERPRRRDAAYLQTQLLIAQKEEAGIQLQAEEFDLMAAAANLDEIEEVNANCILMANLQQASTSGTQSDKAPVYDSDGSAEVHDYENCDDNEIFNMFTQEEQYTELLEPVPEPHQVPQNDNNIIFEVTNVEQSRETVEQHPANFEETLTLYDSLYQNLAIEVDKVNSVNHKLKETNADLTTELARFKNQEMCFEIS
nr:hypothetical protein [Tanacetum cinerariifolium]